MLYIRVVFYYKEVLRFWKFGGLQLYTVKKILFLISQKKKKNCVVVQINYTTLIYYDKIADFKFVTYSDTKNIMHT